VTETELARVRGPEDRLAAADTTLPPKTFLIGQGYWYLRNDTNGLPWTEPRPYSDPFPTAGDMPIVESLGVQTEGTAVELTVCAPGGPDRTWKILSKDIQPNEAFNPVRGWQIAAENLSAAPSGRFTWTDRTGANRPPACQVFGRCYVVARSDVVLVPEVMGLSATAGSVAQSASNAVGSAATFSLNPTAFPTQPDTTGANPPDASALSLHDRPAVIYVDRNAGQDDLSGFLPVVAGAHGPKKTIRAGLAATRNGDILAISGGDYAEHLSVAAKHVSVLLLGNVRLQGRGTTAAAPQIAVPPSAGTNSLNPATSP